MAFALTTFGINRANAQLRVLGGNSISFGKVYQTGAKVNKVIVIRNDGKDTVTIRKVTTSCGCTAALVSRQVLRPGEEAEVKIQFNPSGYVGDVAKYIYISNSDPENQLLTVKMTGVVAYVLNPSPAYVYFNNLREGKKDSTEVMLTNTGNQTLAITRIDVPSKEIIFKLSKRRLMPGESAKIDFYLTPPNRRDVDGYVVIHTTSREQPQLPLKVYAMLVSNIAKP